MNNYIRLAALAGTSTLTMLALTYLSTYRIDQVFLSETRAYIALTMGAATTVMTLVFMRQNFTRRGLNRAIIAVAIVVFGTALQLIRSQATIDDTAYLKAMIPHQSVAILMSARAHITDPRVRVLADEIIMTERRQIERMKALIAGSASARPATE
jgi:uncharacterized protein (DUF305 family)